MAKFKFKLKDLLLPVFFAAMGYMVIQLTYKLLEDAIIYIFGEKTWHDIGFRIALVLVTLGVMWVIITRTNVVKHLGGFGLPVLHT